MKRAICIYLFLNTLMLLAFIYLAYSESSKSTVKASNVERCISICDQEPDWTRCMRYCLGLDK